MASASTQPQANSLSLTAEITVNELLQRHPSMLSTLHALGVHTCCGGGLSLSTAAMNAGIEPGTLLDRVAAAIDMERQR
jgi:iron-sulfur cluster repair protein YtfE (RIC family)